MNSGFKRFVRMAKQILPPTPSRDTDQYVHISEDGIRITAGDYSLMYQLPENTVQGTMLLPFGLIARITRLKNFSRYPLSFDTTGINAGGRRLQPDRAGVPDLPDYPALPDVHFIPADRWKQDITDSLKTHSGFCSADPLKPALNGIDVCCNDDELVLTATDGYRLIRSRFTDYRNREQYQLLLLPRVVAILALMPGEVEVSIATRHTPEPDSEKAPDDSPRTSFIRFESGEFTLIVPEVHEAYPDTAPFINADVKGVLSCDRKELHDFLEEAITLSGGKFTAINLDVSGNEYELTVIPNPLETVLEQFTITETFPGMHYGAPFSIAFNARYLLAILSCIDAERISLAYSRWDRAAHITFDQATTAAVDILLMPLRSIAGFTPRYPHFEISEIAV